MKQKFIFFCTLLLIPLSFLSLFGQFTNSRNTSLVIAGNTEMSFDCGLINSGTIDNSGTMYVSGDWDNKAVYTKSSGKVVLNGLSQKINHNQQSFHTLEITGDDIIIENSMDIEGMLILNCGVVTPTPNTILLIKQDAGIVNTFSNSYINSTLYHEGNGQKFFPIGKNGHYRPVTLQNIREPSPIIGLETFNINPSPVCGPNINKVTSEMYWQLTQLSGSFEGSEVELDFSYGITDLSGYLVIAQADSLGENFASIGNRKHDNSLIISELPLTGSVFTVAEYDDYAIEIMNIITPNNDGVNDVLYIDNLEIYPNNEVIVLNRTGTKVFSARNYDNTWDTKINGKYLSSGNYICILNIKGHTKVYKQMVSILK